MTNTTVAKILTELKKNEMVEICGWVKTFRANRFIALNDGSCLENDCAGECGGDAVLDDCGVCDGQNTAQDCLGECFGDAEIDDCGCLLYTSPSPRD